MELELSLLVKTVLFLAEKLLLLFLVLAKEALGLRLQLVLVVLHLLAQHTATILCLHFNLMLKGSQLLFILALFLALKLQNLTIGFLLHVAFLLL